MKKTVLILISCIMIFVLVGCSAPQKVAINDMENSEATEEPNEEPTEKPTEEPTPEPTEEPTPEPTEEPTPEPNAFDEESVISSLTVEVYDYVSSIKTPWAFLVIKNNSEFNLNINVAIKTYDEDGNLIGAKDKDQEAFEKGTEVILTYMLDEKFSSLEYEITAEEEDWYECVVSDLSVEIVDAKDKEIVSVTNTGEDPAEFVEGTILFLKDGELVYWDHTYFTDDDHEIKPDDTITKELKSYEKYDSYKLCFTGRR